MDETTNILQEVWFNRAEDDFEQRIPDLNIETLLAAAIEILDLTEDEDDA